MRERKHRVGLLASGAPPSWRAITHPSVSTDGEHLSTWLSLAESLWSLLIFRKVDQPCNFPTHREVNPGPPFCSRLILSSFVFSVHLLRESFPRAGVCTHFFCPHFQSLQLCRPFHFPFSFKYPTAPLCRHGIIPSLLRKWSHHQQTHYLYTWSFPTSILKKGEYLHMCKYYINNFLM